MKKLDHDKIAEALGGDRLGPVSSVGSGYFAATQLAAEVGDCSTGVIPSARPKCRICGSPKSFRGWDREAKRGVWLCPCAEAKP